MMTGSTATRCDLEDLLDQLDELGVESVFDGPPIACPVCRGWVDQLVLELEEVRTNPTCCPGCGAVLAT